MQDICMYEYFVIMSITESHLTRIVFIYLIKILQYKKLKILDIYRYVPLFYIFNYNKL